MPWGNRRLTGLVQALHRGPDFVHAPGKEIANQQVGDSAPELGIPADELTETEACIVLTNQPPHAVNALVEDRTPLAELSGRGVAGRQSLDDGVGGHLTGMKREKDSGGVKGIEEAEGI